MKKVCKFVKLAVIATAIGETIASYYKDEKFKSNLDNAKGFDKCKVIFSNLVDLNTKFFTQVKEVDYKSKYEDFKSITETKINDLNMKVDEVKVKLNTMKEEKVLPFISEMEEKINSFKNEIETKVSDINEKIKLEEKIELVKSKIEEVKEKITK